MNYLRAADALCFGVGKVLDTDFPARYVRSNDWGIFAVFSGEPADRFCGIVTAEEISKHPGWIFADLLAQKPLRSVSPEADAASILQLMEESKLDAIAVLDEAGAWQGAITRTSLLNALLGRERRLLEETRRLKEELALRQHTLTSWETKQAELWKATCDLLRVLAHTSAEKELLQEGIDVLARVFGARYGAIALIDRQQQLVAFVYHGMTDAEVSAIGRFPEGKGLLGVVVHNNESLRLIDLKKHPSSIGFPEGHPSMSALLAVPISHRDEIYGRIYLCDKVDGAEFTETDEMHAKSFAHSLALALDNARETEKNRTAQQTLYRMAHYDALTNLPNRQLFEDRLAQVYAMSQRTKQRFAVMFIDLDNFKAVNDTLGHSAGDSLIRTVGERLVACVREVDTVARWGGDEFVLILANLATPKDSELVARKLLSVINKPLDLLEHEIFPGASIGIALFPDDADTIETLIAKADAAMYYTKACGKNGFQVYSSAVIGNSSRHLKLESNLRRSLEKRELFLEFQPQVTTLTGQIVGMEALLRWRNKELGLVSPSDFIPIAENAGLISVIGDWVLRSACTQARSWEKSGYSVRIAVNISALQFQKEGFFETVKGILEETSLSPGLLELEITESLLMGNEAKVIDVLRALKQLGLRFALDDFGTGYSSLSYLKRMPIDVLKIDQSFVRDIASDPSDAAIVSAISVMARELKLDVVAEGVETQEQLAFLIGCNCQSMQGFIFGKPVAAERALELLERGRLEPV